jgi:hypothetical protein
VLRGATVIPDSGPPGYDGVQAASNPDPLFYRPDVDAPRHERLLERALAPVRSPGLRAPWWPVLGNHDVLVQGELGPDAAIGAIAAGDRLIVDPDSELLALARRGLLDRDRIEALIRTASSSRALRVGPDLRRLHLGPDEAVTRLRAAADDRPGASAGRLDYRFDLGADVAVIVLDLARRDLGGTGVVEASTLAFLADELAVLGERRVLVVCHQPLDSSSGGEAVLALLDRDPRVVAVLCGHTHRNAIEPRPSATGGYWLVTGASIVDFPQQWRALRLVSTSSGGVALETWMVDHAGRPGDEEDLAAIARDLAFLDPQGGRPALAAGPPLARNVRLHLPARPARAPAPRALPELPEGRPSPGLSGAGDALVS